MIAEFIGDDRGEHLLDVLPYGRGPAWSILDAKVFQQAATITD